MALSNYYKENAVWLYHSNTNGLDVAVSPTLETMLGDDKELDLSALINNGSTFTQLNTGYFGMHPVVYPASDFTSMIADNPANVEYLGSALIVTDLNGGYNYTTHNGCLVNLNAKQGMNVNVWGYYGWDYIKNIRFVLNTRPHVSGTSSGQEVNWDSVTNWMSLKRFVLKPWYHYTDLNNHFINSTGRTNNYGEIPVDRRNMMTEVEYNVWLSNYDESGSGSTNTNNMQMCSLVFFFKINNEIWMTNHPEQCYPVELTNRVPTYQPQILPAGYPVAYVGIGEFNKTENVSKQLPTSDNEKGWRFANLAISGYNQPCSAYVNTVNAMYYYVNSTGLRWSDRKEGIGTFEQYRQTIRLGVMDGFGVVKHDEWIVGEQQILASSNPNKTGDYSNLPDRRTEDSDPNMPLDPSDFHDTFGTPAIPSATNLYAVNVLDVANFFTFLNEQPTSDLMEHNLLSLHMFPFDDVMDRGDYADIVIGGKPAEYTNSEGVKVTAQGIPQSHLYRKTFGTFVVYPYFKDFRDYSTNYEVFLPMVGFVPISTQVCLGHTISVTAVIERTTGDMIYTLKDENTGVVIATINAVIGAEIPLTSTGVGQLKLARSRAVSNAVMDIVNQSLGAWGNFVDPEAGTHGKVKGVMGVAGSVINTAYNAIELQNKSFASTTAIAMDSLPSFATPSTMALRITRVEKDIPEGYGHTFGFVCNKFVQLKSLSGYTECSNVDVNSIPCTDSERQLIKSLLENGVYL